ncbi:MAG: hypothetical protein KF757_05150 [Phycisphaeraceae bacterium]|nr:hypothetical protein [Phycisphaeraceae bacterium]MCW5763845.1 hypothetical protein [Phycisphaeraceae bacterium]
MAGVKAVLGYGSVALLGLGASLLGYQLLRADLAESVYRARLENLASEYETLRSTYNEAVKRTAVTELIVREGKLSVRIRNAGGVIEEIATPYDPKREIFVDYAIVDGRLWIRRVFDVLTPPARGVLIDPALAEIDWEQDHALYGKAVYRSLDEGRWVVTVSGDGSLGLMRAGPEPVVLSSPVQLGSFEEIDAELRGRIAQIRPGDVWREFWGR